MGANRKNIDINLLAPILDFENRSQRWDSLGPQQLRTIPIEEAIEKLPRLESLEW